MSETRKINPLVAIAAVSVTIFSLVGIGMMTGVVPSSFSKSSDTVVQKSAADTKSANTTSSSKSESSKPRAQAQAKNAETKPSVPVEQAKVAAVCNNCGVVSSVNAIKQKGEGSGLGAVAGGVIGGVLGNQVGGGSGQKIATVAGVAGGAYAGHQVEKNMKSTTNYEVVVRMDDGSTRSFSYDTQPAFQVGGKVRVVNGTLTAG